MVRKKLQTYREVDLDDAGVLQSQASAQALLVIREVSNSRL